MDRVQRFKLILWSITGLAAAVALTRFIFGLGVTTNLTDATPWGLWIGFDVMGGVALAAGGFVMTAIVYIMRREEFHPIVKPAVLTAFLGYVAVILSLLVDLGLPWNIWQMMIYWNPHSPLFEVGWCVMLYTTVLLLEFSPVPLEETSRYAKIRTTLMRFRFPLVMLGIMLSTLHQSSLGSLFLIMPYKIHPLWYSAILPILFFVSAVALGLGMVSFESLISSYLYRRKPESHLVAKLGKALVWVLGIFLVLRLGEIIMSGEGGMIFQGTWESYLFIAEMLIAVIIPMILFSIPRIRNSSGGQWTGAAMVVFGIVLNRINVGGITQMSATGDFYLPSWMEVAMSAGVVSFMVLVFLFAIEHFHVWDERPVDPEINPDEGAHFSHGAEVWLGTPLVAARTKYTLVFVLAFAIGFAMMPGDDISSKGIEQVTARQARGSSESIVIDGNRDGFSVLFAHDAHVKRMGDSTSCVRCHHMNMPEDKNSGCYHCHSGMYTITDAFRHDWHSSPDGARLSCVDCHTKGVERSAESAKTCDQCHLDLYREGATIAVKEFQAVSYVDAMHDLCVTCHRKEATTTEERVNLAVCSTCHVAMEASHLTPDARGIYNRREFNHVTLPGTPTPEGL